MEDKWYQVPGYEGLYEFSMPNKIKSLERTIGHRFGGQRKYKGCMVVPLKDGHGYLRVIIAKDGVKRYFSLHRMIAMIFIPNPENKPCVNHINGNVLDNSIENLEWVTHSENNQHAFDIGLRKAPWAGKTGKLNPSSIRVSQFSLDGELIRIFDSFADIKRDIGFSTQYIRNVCRGKLEKANGFKWKYTDK